MSYTPETEKISDLITPCVENLEAIRERMMNRLSSTSTNYSELHLVDLRIAIGQITSLELTLLRFK